MEPESQKLKLDNSSSYQPETTSPPLCANNCGFFGNSQTNNLCSKCYKEYVLKQSKETPIQVQNFGATTHNSASLAQPVDELVSIGETRQGKDGVAPAIVEKTAGASTASEEAASSAAVPANRCNFCRKRVGLTGFECRCGHTFCSLHRYSDKHNCVFDYKSAGQDAIAKANPVVKADKIDKI